MAGVENAEGTGLSRLVRPASSSVERLSNKRQDARAAAGASFVTKGHTFRTYDWATAAGLLDRMLSSYSLADEIAPEGSRFDLSG